MRFVSRIPVCLFIATLATSILNLPPARAADEVPRVLLDRQTAEIHEALTKVHNWSYIDQPLRDVARHVAHTLGIEVILDARSLEEFGIDAATPVTQTISGISGKSFLRLALKDLELTCIIRDGSLWITTLEEAEASLTTRIYPIGDIIGAAPDPSEAFAAGEGGGGGFACGVNGGCVHWCASYPVGRSLPRVDYDSLIDAITSIISPNSWDDVGGHGAIEGLYESLVVSQTEELHDELGAFLTAYRQVIEADQSEDGAGVRPFPLRSEQVDKLQAALQTPLTIMFRDTPLSDVAKSLSSEAKVPVLLDMKAIEDVGIDGSTPVSGRFAERPLEIVLRRLLHELDLTYTVRNEVILILTHEEAEAELETRFYPVRDLVSDGSDDPSTFDFDSLIDLITSTIAPDSWDDVGGPGSIEPLVAAPALVFSQTRDVHDKVAKLLVKLRVAKQHELSRKEKKEDDPNKITLRAYHLVLPMEQSDPDAVIDIILRTTDEEMWEDDEKTFIEPLGHSIVLNHNANAHQRVAKLLTELGVWSNWVGFGGGQLGGGQFGGGRQTAPQGGGGAGAQGGVF